MQILRWAFGWIGLLMRVAGRDDRRVRRWGLTIPLTGMSLSDHEPVAAAAVAAGYTDLWTSEVNGVDAFTPLVLAAGWQPSVRLGTAIVPVFTHPDGDVEALLHDHVGELVDRRGDHEALALRVVGRQVGAAARERDPERGLRDDHAALPRLARSAQACR